MSCKEVVTAYAILLEHPCPGLRWFHKFNKRSNRIQSAWSLAGAELFIDSNGERIKKVLGLLVSKGYDPKVFEVSAKGVEL